MLYPANFKEDDKGFITVTFRDIPEAISCGKNEAEARSMAVDALRTAIEFYFEDKKQVPEPSAQEKDEFLIKLSASISNKILLLNEMVKQNVSQTELAKRLNVSKQSVNRLIDINHATKIDAIDKALNALGKEIEFNVKDLEFQQN